MKGTHFALTDEIQRAVTNEPNGLSDHDFQGWQRREKPSLDAQRDYFEGDQQT